MEQRKIIGLYTALPESVHGQRITAGIMRQCEKYGYHLCVFGSMTHLEYQNEAYRRGEMNIFELANCRRLDGIIFDTSTLMGDRSGEIINHLCERLEVKPGIPAVALEMPIEGLPMMENRNEDILREMCRHIIEVHGKTRLCILTGQKGNDVAESRLGVLLDEISKHGLTVAPEHIVYGDFWYTSGDKLADDFLSGAIPMPEAVICASDHMALGLIDKLDKKGVKIPDELLVISFDATEEGASNKITLSSYEANDANSAADAVDYIRSVIEPGAEIIPYEADSSEMFHPAMSCGCEPDYLRSARSLQHALYHTARNYADSELMERIDIGLLMESYVLERFTGSETPEECMEHIFGSTYILNPYVNFYLCLREDWLDTDHDRTMGYPDKMKIAVYASQKGEGGFCTEEQSIVFDTELMLPQLYEESEEPAVYFFSPIHFFGKVLGYSVLQRDIHEAFGMNLVYRNWLRFVNNALEMIRAKKRLQTLSFRDEMTGAYNRRGMYMELDRMLQEAEEGSSMFVCVIDMDGLKYINDTFGHNEGDFGIRLVSSAAAEITQPNEIFVRAGGDEFYLIGVGQYSEEDIQKREDMFSKVMERQSKTYQKPYIVTASVGSAMKEVTKSLHIEEIISIADEKMYLYKARRKRQRKD